MTHNRRVRFFIQTFKDLQHPPWEIPQTCCVITWSIRQKMWASSCWKRRTRVRPVSVPDSSFLCRTPKSASLRGSSLHERGLWLNMRLQDEQRAGVGDIRGPWRDRNWIHYVGDKLTDETNERYEFLPVPGAVHGLECKDIFFHGEGEHVVAVVLPVARCLPQFTVINVWGSHFLEASSPVLLLDKWQNHINKLKSPLCRHRYFIELSSWLLHWREQEKNKNIKQVCWDLCGFFFLNIYFP